MTKAHIFWMKPWKHWPRNFRSITESPPPTTLDVMVRQRVQTKPWKVSRQKWHKQAKVPGTCIYTQHSRSSVQSNNKTDSIQIGLWPGSCCALWVDSTSIKNFSAISNGPRIKLEKSATGAGKATWITPKSIVGTRGSPEKNEGLPWQNPEGKETQRRRPSSLVSWELGGKKEKPHHRMDTTILDSQNLQKWVIQTHGSAKDWNSQKGSTWASSGNTI